MTSKFDSLTALLKGALGDRLAPAEDFLKLFTNDTVLLFPYAPEGLPQRVDGVVELAAHLARLGPLLEFGEMSLHAVYPSGDTVVFEASCDGKGVATGRPYNQAFISVITLHDGRIAEYRDYWNPLIVLSALGGAEAAIASFKAGADA